MGLFLSRSQFRLPCFFCFLFFAALEEAREWQFTDRPRTAGGGLPFSRSRAGFHDNQRGNPPAFAAPGRDTTLYSVVLARPTMMQSFAS